MLHRYLLTARELEIIYNLVSSDYLVSAEVTGSYASNNVVKNEIMMHILVDKLFKENEKLARCREGLQTYGYCAWCDAPIVNPNKLWKHYQDQDQVLMQVAPMSPPSAWQTWRWEHEPLSSKPRLVSSSIG